MSLSKGIVYFGGLFAVLVSGLAQPAQAQDGSTPVTRETAPSDGQLIYARDVQHSMGAPYFRGASHAAVTAPTSVVVTAVSIGLAPLSDREAAHVTASLRGHVENFVRSDLASIMRDQPASRTNDIAGAQTSVLSGGSVISGAMDALAGALESLSAIGGGRP